MLFTLNCFGTCSNTVNYVNGKVVLDKSKIKWHTIYTMYTMFGSFFFFLATKYYEKVSLVTVCRLVFRTLMAKRASESKSRESLTTN